ncbi:MAG: hypothetical protein CML09_04895 [Puniceicoccaceae bacterium]|nr:hypothetical protein [Puniceicoccaceae bacterium]
MKFIIILSSLFLFSLVYGETSMEMLEKRINILEKQMKDLQLYKITGNKAFADKRQLSDKDIEKLADKVFKEEEQNIYPWMDESKWILLELGMSPDEVKSILGKPIREFPSLNKRIDVAFIYKGRRIPSNKLVEGVVRFYKDELIEFEVPNF